VLLAEADAVVFANAAEASALWSRAQGTTRAAGPQWIAPLARTRGQVSLIAAGTPGLRAPSLAIAGAGLRDRVARWRRDVRRHQRRRRRGRARAPRDHSHNLRQLAALTGSSVLQAPRRVAAPAGEGR
jgi:hypothetical protein